MNDVWTLRLVALGLVLGAVLALVLGNDTATALFGGALAGFLANTVLTTSSPVPERYVAPPDQLDDSAPVAPETVTLPGHS